MKTSCKNNNCFSPFYLVPAISFSKEYGGMNTLAGNLFRKLKFTMFLLSFQLGIENDGAFCFAQDTLRFVYTGVVDTFIVPECVYTIQVKAWGAGGSGGGSDNSVLGAVGGAGAFIQSSVPVTPGQVIQVVVGGGAGPGQSSMGGFGGGTFGWGNGYMDGGAGGATGATYGSGGGGGGGGGSGLIGGNLFLLVAGGGGGGSGGGQFSSGAEGGAGGVDGNIVPGSCVSYGAAGAGVNGNGIIGANKGPGDGGGGGGGGGGFNGGGGGGIATLCDCGACGGGGGTSWSLGNGTIITLGNGQVPGNSNDLVLPAGAAIGGNASNKGGDGFVQIIFPIPPITDFYHNTVCAGNATIFTDNTVNTAGTIVSRSWNFNDGSPLSNLISPTHTFANGGIYPVVLIVNNSYACPDTTIKMVEVYYKPLPTFNHNDVCYGDTISFTNTSSIDTSNSITNYLWRFGDGSAVSNLQNPVHYYATGSYPVTLVVTSAEGCKDSLIKTVNTFDAPTAGFTFTNVCNNNLALFTNTSVNPAMGSTASWSWDFGDGSPLNNTDISPQHFYTAPGNYQVSLITVSSNISCSDTFQNTISVFTLPVANFSLMDVCLNQAVNFYDSSTVSVGNIVSKSWNFGDATPLSTAQNPIHSYASPGTYNVSLIVTTNNGCKDTLTKIVVVHPMPVAQFSTANSCFQLNTQFIDASTIGFGDVIQSWQWNFGDGSPVGSANLLAQTSHLYSSTGNYSVVFTVVSNFNCSNAITQNVIIHSNPICNFNNAIACNNNEAQFTDVSTTASGTLAEWLWDFGDGSPPINSTFNPSYIYTNVGNYTITLIVKNSFNCVDTLSKAIQVFYSPIVSFNHSNVCFGDSVVFTNTSNINSSTSIVSYLWTFDDAGLTSSLQNPSHNYPTGIYSVLLLATSAEGCSDTSSAVVKTFDPPDAVFLFSNTCQVNSALITNNTTDPSIGNTASWSWDFGDGSPLNTATWSPQHLYAAAGNYMITLVAKSSNLGCVDTFQNTISIFPMPTAAFSFTDICLEQTNNFIDLSSVINDNILSRNWLFGDGSPQSSVQDPNHLYAISGTYPVTLVVTTSNSCMDTIVKNVVIHPLPIVLFSQENVCEGNMMQFNYLSTIPASDTIQSWKWNFGDGSPGNYNQNPSHLYASNGNYAVNLWVVSNFGCEDSTTIISYVNPNPIVNFKSNNLQGCELFCTSFQDSSFIATGNNIQWKWDLGDGTLVNNSQVFDHCYDNDSVYVPSTFDVKITVISDSGCSISLTKSNYITVYSTPTADFSVNPETATAMDPVISITDLSTSASFWAWNFGDGSATINLSLQSSSIHTPPPHTYADTGTYTIMLITSAQFSCADTAYHTIVIEPEFVFYIPNAFSPDDDGENDSFTGKGLFVKKFKMSIFDRWGNMIFYSDDANKPWEGKSSNEIDILTQDIYVYIFDITDTKNVKHRYKGSVLLLK